MVSRAYELYGVPTAPENPTQEYMTVQETAYVLKCSVSWLRRLLRKHDELCGRNGRSGRITTNSTQRAEIHVIRSVGNPRTGRPAPRRRSPRHTPPKAMAEGAPGSEGA